MAARAHIVARLHHAGFTDLQAAHLAVFQHPGPHGLTPGELARRSGSSKQAIGNLLSQLESAGYLRRVTDPANGRQRIVELTDRGRDAVDHIRSAVTELESRWQSQLGDTNYRRFRRLLEQLNDVVADSG